MAGMACTMGSAMFTEEELDSMYQIELSQDGSTLLPGSRVSAVEPLAVSVNGIDGAPEAASLELLLSGPDGTEAASIIFAGADSALEGAVTVKDLENDVPPFTMPAGLAEGYYTLSVKIKNSAGATLSKYTTALLLFEGSIPAPSLAVYPGVVTADEVSLLRLEGDYPAGLDPWIRWTVDGTVRATGFASEHADRLAWRAPSASGVYLAKAELYPFQPPTGYELEPLAKAEIRLPLATGLKATDPLEPNGAWTRLTFDGDFVDKGTRDDTQDLAIIGTPYLEAYPSGFGYLLGAGAGVSSAVSLVPAHQADGHLAAFTAIFTFAQAPGTAETDTGTLLSAAGTRGGAGFVIGVEAGRPYFRSGTSSILSNAELRSSVTKLAVYVEPSEQGVFVEFYVDDIQAGSGSFASSLSESTIGACTIAGKQGYIAVYDELRIIEGPYPAFRLSQEAARGKALMAASGFEGGVLDAGFETSGDAIGLAHGSISIGPGASLAVGTALPAQGASLSFRLVAGAAAASLQLDDGAVLVVDTSGTIMLGDEDTGFDLPIEDPSTLFISVEPTETGLRVYGPDDTWILIKASAPVPDARWTLSSIGDGTAVITNVSVYEFSAPLASARKEQRTPGGSESSPTVDTTPKPSARLLSTGTLFAALGQ